MTGKLRERMHWLVRESERAELFGSWRLRALLAHDFVRMRLRGAGLHPPRPRLIQLEPTRACNLRCPMCLRTSAASATAEMRFPLFREIVERNFDYAHFLLLYGQGEPLLCRDLFEMIRYEHARGRHVVTVTNGTLLDAAASAEMATSGLDLLRVSIDGATPATYAAIRPGADLGVVLGNLERLLGTLDHYRARTRLAITCMVLQRNYHELPALVRLVAGLGIRLLEIKDVPWYVDEPATSLSLAMQRDPELGREVAAVVATAAQEARRRRVRLITARFGRSRGATGCRNPWYKCFVAADGRLSPCSKLCMSPEATVGRLPGDTFASLWHGPEYERIRTCIRRSDVPFDACRTHEG